MKQTIYLTIGPSQCGKSHFAERLKSALNAADKRGTILSSDDLRREVHGDDSLSYGENQNRMMAMSKAAFELMRVKLKLFTTWPQVQDFIIVDSTGFNADFRKSILDLAEDQHYKVVALMFDYKDKNEYMKHLRGDISTTVIHKHIKALRTNVLPVLERKRMEIVRIKSFDDHDKALKGIFDTLEADMKGDKPEVEDCIIRDDCEYLIVGDIHGCINTFKDLLIKAGFEINGDKITGHPYGKKICLAGDLVDKGQYSVETLRFALNNLETMVWVDDNHSRFIQHKLSGKDIGMSDEFLNKYFGSWKEFEVPENRVLLDQYLHLAKPFLVLNGGDVVVTHSPCPMKYLQKYDFRSRKFQRNWREYKENFKSLLSEADIGLPFRVFGHVATSDGIKYKNLIGIDTGAVHTDGKLTGVVITRDRKVFYTTVPRNENDAPFDEPLGHSSTLIGKTRESFDINNLTGRDRNRIKWAQIQKINFVSGTISPSMSTETEFEPVETALNVYKENGHSLVMLQKKHMGSRAQVYIHNNPELDFATSRSGHPIKGYHNEEGERIEDLKPLFEELRESSLIKELLEENRTIVLDCEFMPWAALGKDLIERTFNSYQKMVEGEISFLDENGFEDVVNQLSNRKDDLLTKVDYFKTPKAQVIETIKHNGYELIKNFLTYKHVSLENHRNGIEIFKQQVELYGKSGKAYFSPFAVLKLVSYDGVNTIVQDQGRYALELNKFTPTMIIEVDKVDQAQKFFDNQVKNGAEGIMVKPLSIDRKSPPAIKVRNEEYLRIIYGHDFGTPEKYAKLCKRKKVFGKMSLSQKEWNIGLNLLEEVYDDIPESSEYAQKFARAIEAENQERELDPRL